MDCVVVRFLRPCQICGLAVAPDPLLVQGMKSLSQAPLSVRFVIKRG